MAQAGGDSDRAQEGARALSTCLTHLEISHNLNSLKGIIFGIVQGTTIWAIRALKGDTRSVDYG